MKNTIAFFSVVLLAAIPAMADLQTSVDMTYQSSQGPYPYQYNLTLHNTGDTTVGTMWYAWDDSGLNFLPSFPYNVNAPQDWSYQVTSSYSYSNSTYNYTYGIEWYATGNPLAAGQDLSGFSFQSFDSPDVLSGISDVPTINPNDPPFPVGTTFTYIGAAFDDPGTQFVVLPTAAPEPTSIAIMAICVCGSLLRRRRVHADR